MQRAEAVLRALKAAADPERAAALQWFFKTGAGEYGEGDRFLGIRVPVLRAIARTYDRLPLTEIQRLLASAWHEARLVALLILVRQHERGTARVRQQVFRFYLRNTARINNWDLVDLSAPSIAGPHLMGADRPRLLRLARSPLLWERRIAVLATFEGIKHQRFAPSLAVARELLDDPHDLIHKAVGWMLREIGKRDPRVAQQFLDAHAARMPRTMLRYAIERLPEQQRRSYLNVARARGANLRGVTGSRSG